MQSLKREFGENLQTLGCFLLNDCLSASTVSSVHEALERLFRKSPAEKAVFGVDKRADPLGAGFSPYGVARAIDTGIPNLLETWDIGTSPKRWPDDLLAEWHVFSVYQRDLRAIATKALTLISAALDCDSSTLTSLVDAVDGGLHLIHYFPLPTDVVAGARRQSEHCDNTLVTLIPPPYPTSTGISVFDRSASRWEDIIIGKDQCLIQSGLLLQRITANSITANLHTVRNPEINSPANVSRYSTPFFLSPRGNKVLSLLPPFQSDETRKQFPDIAVKDLQASYFARIFRK